MKILDRDYIWECDYGNRRNIKIIIEQLLYEQDVTSLQMVNVFVNNVPYQLELFVIISYKDPKEDDINKMCKLFKDEGATHRTDLTQILLISEMMHRRFDSGTINESNEVESVFKYLCRFPERSEYAEQGFKFGIDFSASDKSKRVFISHSSKDKEHIEELIPYLSGLNLPVWYDKVNIDYGENITNKVQEGMDDSEAAIFWVTKNFLDSKWCNEEMSTFITLCIERNNLPIIIKNGDVLHEDLPLFMRKMKYVKIEELINFNAIANEIKTPLKKKLNII